MLRLLLAALSASTLVAVGTATPDRAAVRDEPLAARTLVADRSLDPVGDPGTGPVVTDDFPAGGATVHLTDVRAAGHGTFDRFVLEFDGDVVPGHRVGYVEPPVTEDGSGRPVQVAGSAFLEVRVTPASGVDLSGGTPRYTYTGRDHVLAPGGRVIAEAVRTGDFEAMLAWTVGLEERVPFGVATLSDPARLVVDVLHPREGGAAGGLAPVGPGGTADLADGGTGAPVVLTDVRLGAHDGFDRVVFEFAGDGRPGYRLGYTDDPRGQGTGRPVEVPGDAALAITLTGLLLPRDAPPGTRPWAGPDEVRIAGAATLQALVPDALFEGRHSFFAGLDERRPFAVARLAQPERLVVDLLTRQPHEVSLGALCTSPAGFSIQHPADWAVNPGEVLPACSRFAPREFRLEQGTDVRVAPIAVSVESIPFAEVTGPRPGERARSALTVDGRDAVRLELTTVEGLHPLGTPITLYAVDLAGERTLVADAVGLAATDHARDVAVLDAMVGTLDLDAGGGT
jgi:hypothetical protein